MAIIGYFIIEIISLNLASKEETQVYFRIEKGQKSLEILDRLVEEKIIKSKYFYPFFKFKIPMGVGACERIFS